MTRIAIVGGGISGLSAAYELELARKRGAAIDWQLYEASDRLGGIVQTTRIPASEAEDGEWILEGGPDGWVTEKPWARELAIELGLEGDLIYSKDSTRKTYILRSTTAQRSPELLAIPDGMRLMVPTDLAALDASPLFSTEAKRSYGDEPARAAELRETALDRPGHQHADESVASFVRRHFGDEVLTTLAAPLLSGVFGGDVHKLSVRAVMPQFVAMERDYGSLITALQAKAAQRTREPQPVFTSLRRGMASLTEAMVASLPPDRLHSGDHIRGLWNESGRWTLDLNLDSHITGRRPSARFSRAPFHRVILSTSLHSTRHLLAPISPKAAQLLPMLASSAVLASFAWPASLARTFTLPPGFGFLVPPSTDNGERTAGNVSLLAATFADQKFPDRAPAGGRILRAFFGSDATSHFSHSPDSQVAGVALAQLRTILGPLPDPAHSVVRRWSGSLPQYEVGHLDRIAELEGLVADIPGLHLLGNSYHGVGLPDLIRDARTTTRALC